MSTVNRVVRSVLLTGALLGAVCASTAVDASGPPTVVPVHLPGRVVACGAPYLIQVGFEAKLLLTGEASGTGRLHVTLASTGGWLLHPNSTRYFPVGKATEKVDVAPGATEVVVPLTMLFRATGPDTLHAQLGLRVVIGSDGALSASIATVSCVVMTH